MSDKDEALRLADALETPTIQAGAFRHEAAAELRRLAGVEAARDALLEALEVARRVITNDRESLVECSTYPDGTMDRAAADYVAYYDAALAQIDEAMKGGGNG